MAQPSADELTQVREAVRQLVTEDQYKVFDECDFELLWKGEYRSVATLKAATRDGLMFIKLPMALVDILKPSQGVQLHVLGDSCQDFGGLSVVHLPAVVYINLDQQA